MRKGSANECPVECDFEKPAQRIAPGAGARDHMATPDLLLPVGRPAGQGDTGLVLFESDHLVAPTHLDQRGSVHRRVHELLGAGLGDVDERRKRRGAAVDPLGEEQLLVAVERATSRPGQAFLRDLLADACCAPDVEHVALLDQRLAPDRVAMGVGVEHDDRKAPPSQEQGRGLTDGPGTDDERQARRCRTSGRVGRGWSWCSPCAVRELGRFDADVSSAAGPRPPGRARRSRSGASRSR